MRALIRRCIILVAAAIWLLPIPTALAQKTASRFEDLAGIIKPGDRVTLTMISGERMSAFVIEVNAASVVVSGSSHQPRTVSSMDIARVAIPDPVGNGIKIGAGVGAGAGLVSGLLVNTYCYNEVGSCPGAVIGLTAIGALGGAAAGWALDSAHGNRIVYDRAGITIPRGSRTEVFTSVDYSRTSSLVFPSLVTHSPREVSVSVGIGRHFASGLGIEGEVQRTVRGDIKQNPCVKVTFGAQAGTCIGPGLEGLESQAVGTGRVVYSLRSVRFQPFVSGGFSVLRCDERFAYVASSVNPIVIQARSIFNDTAMPVGGGFRVPLTRSLAIRPAVTYYIGAERTTVSVGFAYRRK
ncbi:MAG TPA: hypothetical protein VK210_11055 [Terriglobia bacterium]|nr:hypothetical protein [Terriglobia bacterium]